LRICGVEEITIPLYCWKLLRLRPW